MSLSLPRNGRMSGSCLVYVRRAPNSVSPLPGGLGDTWSPELSHPGGRAIQAQATDLLEPIATAGVVTVSSRLRRDDGEESEHVHTRILEPWPPSEGERSRLTNGSKRPRLFFPPLSRRVWSACDVPGALLESWLPLAYISWRYKT